MTPLCTRSLPLLFFWAANTPAQKKPKLCEHRDHVGDCPHLTECLHTHAQLVFVGYEVNEIKLTPGLKEEGDITKWREKGIPGRETARTKARSERWSAEL